MNATFAVLQKQEDRLLRHRQTAEIRSKEFESYLGDAISNGKTEQQETPQDKKRNSLAK
jgi:hypothetical protein